MRGPMESIAKQAHDGRWEEMKQRLILDDDVDLDETFSGRAALHWATMKNQPEMITLLLTHGNEDVNKRQSYGNQTALHLAAQFNLVECVKTLLANDADLELKDGEGMTALHMAAKANYPDVVQVLLEYEASIDTTDNVGKTPLDVATGTSRTLIKKGSSVRSEIVRHHFTFIHDGEDARVIEWLKEKPQDLDKCDDHGRTALIHAVVVNKESLVKAILTHGPNVDFADSDGRTALMHAVVKGNLAIMTMLLREFADIDVEDAEGNTALSLAGDMIEEHDDDAKQVATWEHCKSLLKKESVYRSSSEEYRNRFQAKLMQVLRKHGGFNESLFRRTINRHPEFGVMFLNECLIVDRHTLRFSHLPSVYGKHVKTSALYSILHPMQHENQDRINKTILSHLVMRRVLELKWEFFAQRIYIEQVLMYIMLAFSMTTSAGLLATPLQHRVDKVGVDMIDVCAFLWIVLVSLAVVGRSVIQFLRPHRLWSCAKYLHDGSWTAFSPDMSLPHLPKLKRRAKKLLFCVAVVLTALLTLVLYTVLPPLGISQETPQNFFLVNSVLLWGTACYFLNLERKELVGEAGGFARGLQSLWNPSVIKQKKIRKEFRTGLKEYFGSTVNLWQLAVYVLILFVYVPCSLALAYQHHTSVQPGTAAPMDALRACILLLATFLTLSLWLLCLQFLEVVPTVGFLLPIMPLLLADVGNFALFYGAVQWGFTVTFYILQHGADQSLVTFGTYFKATYFVMFGNNYDNDNSKLNLDESTVAAQAIELYGTILSMLNSAVVVLLLMNMLMAMMNKTVGDGLERAKTEALVSYARSILRIELAVRYSNQSNSEAVMFIAADATSETTADDDLEGSFKGRSATVVLFPNPAFSESKIKSDFIQTAEDAQVVRACEESVKEWHVSMEALRNALQTHWAILRKRVHEHVEMYEDEAKQETMLRTLEKRERSIRTHLTNVTASTHATKLNVEAHFNHVSQHLCDQIDKLSKHDEGLKRHVDQAKSALAAEFDRQIKRTRDVLNESADVTDVWKLTQRQWAKQDLRHEETNRQIEALTAKLDLLLAHHGDAAKSRGLLKHTMSEL
ncbi:Aste57867_3165 [Aphanomyces stellatus]|uniref:Aste57867_3165 protein n=1 Tax=Aphanomyces stellatus TaxID=120398 RepID=A0A485KCX5_9STRA|nr:hypothetical protein As57867_003156 [Aphanomyces stellatus]VFT80339.1 Aste57867_3165 [Aphanomyces stellatus]